MRFLLPVPFLIGCISTEALEGQEPNIDSDAFNTSARAGVQFDGHNPIPGAIDGYNHPSLLSEDFLYTFDELPLRGELDREPWSGSYWPKREGGISHRWRIDEALDYELFSKEELLNADTELISNLSPSEKYDLYVGNYKWPLTHKARAAGSESEASWTGYCHGWTPASADYPEPHSVVVVNEDGIRIPFASSDIKALLTFYRGEVVTSTYVQHEWRAETHVLGGSCGSENPTDPSCYDTNPGAFHIALTNRVGLEKKNLFLDADNSREKWNQPIFRYDSKVLWSQEPSSGASEEAVAEYVVETEAEWTLEIEPQWTPVLNTNTQHTKVETFRYTLEVDRDGEIVGGQWLALTQSGGYISMGDAWTYLTQLDENEDGVPDLNEQQASETIWAHFRFPDYLWIQDDVSFHNDFEQPYNEYAIISNSGTGREVLYKYFGKLEGLYRASLD